MAFSHEWDKAYKNSCQMSKWPWSDLVSYVMRLNLAQNLKVLEIGCGAGANIPFFLDLEVEYFAIEGSETIVSQIKRKYPRLSNRIVKGDFTTELPFCHKFDLVVDRSALTHNDTSAIQESIRLIQNKLQKGGYFIGIDWFSTLHSNANDGYEVDSYTRSNCQGQFKGVGKVHFSDKHHLYKLFKDFSFLKLEHKVIETIVPRSHNFAAWNFILQKK